MYTGLKLEGRAGVLVFPTKHEHHCHHPETSAAGGDKEGEGPRTHAVGVWGGSGPPSYVVYVLIGRYGDCPECHSFSTKTNFCSCRHGTTATTTPIFHSRLGLGPGVCSLVPDMESNGTTPSSTRPHTLSCTRKQTKPNQALTHTPLHAKPKKPKL